MIAPNSPLLYKKVRTLFIKDKKAIQNKNNTNFKKARKVNRFKQRFYKLYKSNVLNICSQVFLVNVKKVIDINMLLSNSLEHNVTIKKHLNLMLINEIKYVHYIKCRNRYKRDLIRKNRIKKEKYSMLVYNINFGKILFNNASDETINSCLRFQLYSQHFFRFFANHTERHLMSVVFMHNRHNLTQ
jgi:hypothetical protein